MPHWVSQLGTISLAIGTVVYNHAGVWTDNGESFLRAGTGSGDVDVTDVSYQFRNQRLFLQMDAYEGGLTASVWSDGDPDSLVQISHPYNPVLAIPSFGVSQGSATVHDVWISTTPLPISFLAGDFDANGVLDVADVDLLVQT